MSNLPAGLRWVGYAYYGTCSSALSINSSAPDNGVTLPSNAQYAVVSTKAQPIVFTCDGSTTPTATKGGIIFANGSRVFENQRTDLKNLKFIEETAGAKVFIEYYEGPNG